MVKTFISLGLSVLVFSGNLHVYLHNHIPTNGYSLCKVGCDDENHRNSFHKCEKWLNKNSKLTNPNCGNLIYEQYSILFIRFSESIKNTITHYSLYSRPPPKLI